MYINTVKNSFTGINNYFQFLFIKLIKTAKIDLQSYISLTKQEGSEIFQRYQAKHLQLSHGLCKHVLSLGVKQS